MALLSVDWDYFFPNPMATKPAGPDWLLYDWGHEESPLYISYLWPDRALNLLLTGKELPMAKGYEQFWQRFRFRRGSKLFVAESHSAIASPELFRRFKRGAVWNYDAHHDAGYHQEDLETIRIRLAIGRVTCEDWVWWYFASGAKVRTIYPIWQGQGNEPEPAVPIERTTDDLEPVVGTSFTGAFLCRSGAWMPSWTDDQFRDFVSRFPGEVVQLRPLVERSFDLEAIRQSTLLQADRQIG